MKKEDITNFRIQKVIDDIKSGELIVKAESNKNNVIVEKLFTNSKKKIFYLQIRAR